MLTLGAIDPIELVSCGLDYHPRTGKALPVCEGFELSARQGPRPMASWAAQNSGDGLASCSGWGQCLQYLAVKFQESSSAAT